MSLFETLFQRGANGSANKAAFRVLTSFIAVMGIFIALGILFPGAVAAVLSTIWVLLLLATIIFFALGILVVVGLRKEASNILDVLMEGSLSIVDFIRFLKLIWMRFLEVLKEFVIYATPVIAYIVTLVIYTILIVIYKSYGKTNDVTIFTILLTAAMVFTIGFLNRPSKKPVDLSIWSNRVKNLFHAAFIDGFEIILFVFFLTMDSTSLVFVPQELNIPLHSEFGGYDFMVRSFVYDSHFRVTVNIIIFAITLEIIRNLLRLGASARRHYTNDLLLFSDGIIASRSHRAKSAIRKAFKGAKDDLVRFITFTTVLFGVFLIFPRLKLLTLGVASLTSLILDIVFLERLFFVRGNDLISRILGKVFKM